MTSSPRVTGRRRRQSISEIRRRELAEATLLTMQEFGVKGTTVQRVSERAGLSHGLVHHYFKSKADMMEAAVRLTNRLITDEVLRLRKSAKTPHERINAVIHGNFAPSVCSRETVQAWASCSGEAAFNERFARTIRMVEWRLKSNLLYDLRKIMPVERAKQAATGLVLIIDGIWLKCARSDSEEIDHEKVMEPVWQYLEMFDEYRATRPGRETA